MSKISTMWELRRVGPAAALLSAACALSEPAPLRPAAEIAAERPTLAEAGIDWSDGLSPDEAARLAALHNPQLRAAREERGEAAAELQAAGFLSDLGLGGDVLHPTSGPGVSDLVTAYGLSLSVDTASLVTRSARIDAATAQVESTDLGLAWQEWQVAQGARLEAVRLGRLRRRLEVARAEIEFLEGTTASLERSVGRGDATLQGLGVQRAALEAARQIRRELESAEATSQSTLLAELGMAPDQPLVVAEGAGAGSAARRRRSSSAAVWRDGSTSRRCGAATTRRRPRCARRCSSSCPRSRSGSTARATRARSASSAAS